MSTAILQRHQTPLVYLAVAAISLPAGMLVATQEKGVSLALLALLGVCGLVLVFYLPVPVLFVGWLFLAPIFQIAAEPSAIGLAGVWVLYTIPALIFVVLTLTHLGSAPTSWLDVFPAAFVALVFGSLVLTSDEFHTRTTGILRYFFLTVAIGVVVYYFLTLGAGRRITGQQILKAILWGGLVQACFSLIEYTTLWSLWPSTGWQDFSREPGRVTGTLANPAVTGTFLGVGIVTAVSVLIWGGPRSLRRLSFWMLALGTPALFSTYTRAPMIATVGAIVVMLVFSRIRYIALIVLAAATLALVAVLPTIQQSGLYQQRFSDTRNILARDNLQDWSIRLWEQKPILGFGWGSYDRVKDASQFAAEGLETWVVRYYTSHNSYLTMLVELGLVGLLLYAVPFVVLGYRGLSRVRFQAPDRWIVIAALSSLFVIVLTASTVDFRFFSIVQMLPWLFLALLRRATTEPQGAE